MASLPPITTVPGLSTEERAAILDTLFEPCTQLHTLSVSTLHEQTFASYSDLIAAIGTQLTTLSASDLASDQEWLSAILSAHPRLGASDPSTLSPASRAEQAQLQTPSTSGSDNAEAEASAAALRTLNGTYETTFPGLRYVVFVNGRARDVILVDMRARIARNDIVAEKADAIAAMCAIATDRAGKLAAPSKTSAHQDENVAWQRKLEKLEAEGMPRHEPLAL